MTSMTVDASSELSQYEWKKVGTLPRQFIPGAKIESTFPTASNEPVQNPADRGYEEGFAEGLCAGREQGRAEQEKLLGLLQLALEETQRLRERTATDGLDDIATSLQHIFTALFQYELQTSPELLRAMAKQLGVILHSQATPKLLISSVDFAALNPILPADLRGQITGDSGLPQGVVRATAGNAMLELDISSNLQQVLSNGVAVLNETDPTEPDEWLNETVVQPSPETDPMVHKETQLDTDADTGL